MTNKCGLYWRKYRPHFSFFFYEENYSINLFLRMRYNLGYVGGYDELGR